MDLFYNTVRRLRRLHTGWPQKNKRLRPRFPIIGQYLFYLHTFSQWLTISLVRMRISSVNSASGVKTAVTIVFSVQKVSLNSTKVHERTEHCIEMFFTESAKMPDFVNRIIFDTRIGWQHEHGSRIFCLLNNHWNSVGLAQQGKSSNGGGISPK